MRRSILPLLVCGAAASTALTGLSFAGAESPKSTGVTTTINVSMTEYRFHLSASSAPVGTVVFEITNDGKAPHDFSIAGKRSATIVSGASTTLTVSFSSSRTEPYLCTLPGHAEAGMLPHNFVIARRQTIVLKRGRRATLEVLLKAGRYKYICSVKGHAALGMRGVLVVR